MEYVTLGKSDLKVSLAWLLTKAASPVVGATKMRHVEGAVKAVDLKLRTTEQVCIKNGKYRK